MKVFDSDTGHDVEIWQEICSLGLAGIVIDEEYGGVSMGSLDLAVCAEAFGYGALPGPFLSHSLATLAIQKGGTSAQKEKWLPALASGEVIGSVAFFDPEGGWNPSDWTLSATSEITGHMRNIPYASEAEIVVVGVKGGRFVLVETDAKGVKVQPLPVNDRTRRLDNLSLNATPCEPLGDESTARSVMMTARILIAADAMGGAARCLDMAVAYAKEREQFGQKIGSFQALKHQLADMALAVEPNRALYWYAAYAIDIADEDAERLGFITKAHITDRYVEVARVATEAHGGIGYTWEYPLHIWLKRALFNRGFLGSPSQMRNQAAKISGWGRTNGC